MGAIILPNMLYGNHLGETYLDPDCKILIYLHLGQKFELIIHIVVFDVEIMQCHWKQMRQTVI